MVLMQWFERGLGQIMAPDKKYSDKPDVIDTKSAFWQIVAPDPKFPEEGGGSSSVATAASASTVAGGGDGGGGAAVAGTPVRVPPAEAFLKQVQCLYCKRFTPVQATKNAAGRMDLSTPSPPLQRGGGGGAAAAPGSDGTSTPHLLTSGRKPVGSAATMGSGGDPALTLLQQQQAIEVGQRILEAARDSAMRTQEGAMTAQEKKRADQVMRLAASQVPLNAKSCEHLRKLVTEDPCLLTVARSFNMAVLCGDGHTPLMAAAMNCNIEATTILLEVGEQQSSDQLFQTNLHGKTALHLAAEKGHVAIVDLLLPYYKKTAGDSEREVKQDILATLPLDVTGRTVLGVAMTSPEPSARKNRSQLVERLFSPEDVSILGSPPPAQQRIRIHAPLQLVYAGSDLPGFRVNQEDAMTADVFWPGGDSSDSKENEGLATAFFAVCDGHADSGRVSRFVVDQLRTLGKEFITDAAPASEETWHHRCHALCLTVDEKLKNERSSSGGSTAVMAMVTPTQIVVANVGDSRCILIRAKAPDPPTGGETGLEESMKDVSLDETAPTSPTAAADPPAKSAPTPTPAKKDEQGGATAISIWDDYDVIAMSKDHKPNLPEELARIENAGLTVSEDYGQTKEGEQIVYPKVVLPGGADRMGCSRTFGDFEYKASRRLGPEEQAVVAVPDVVVRERATELDGFLVLASDGVWDVMTNEDVGQFIIQEGIQKQMNATPSAATTDPSSLASLADQLLQECLRRGSQDNMTVVLVALSKAAESFGASALLKGKALTFN